MITIPDEFTCALCGETFPKGWSDEEAIIEFGQIFPDEVLDEECVVVCDHCHKLMGLS